MDPLSSVKSFSAQAATFLNDKILTPLSSLDKRIYYAALMVIGYMTVCGLILYFAKYKAQPALPTQNPNPAPNQPSVLPVAVQTLKPQTPSAPQEMRKSEDLDDLDDISDFNPHASSEPVFALAPILVASEPITASASAHVMPQLIVTPTPVTVIPKPIGNPAPANVIPQLIGAPAPADVIHQPIATPAPANVISKPIVTPAPVTAAPQTHVTTSIELDVPDVSDSEPPPVLPVQFFTDGQIENLQQAKIQEPTVEEWALMYKGFATDLEHQLNAENLKEFIKEFEGFQANQKLQIRFQSGKASPIMIFISSVMFNKPTSLNIDNLEAFVRYLLIKDVIVGYKKVGMFRLFKDVADLPADAVTLEKIKNQA